jgi:hypothetical protein
MNDNIKNIKILYNKHDDNYSFLLQKYDCKNTKFDLLKTIILDNMKYLIYPVGYNNLSKSFNKSIQYLYNKIFINDKYIFLDIFNDPKLNEIIKKFNNYIDNYLIINIDNYDTNLIKSIKSKLNLQYKISNDNNIKQYIKHYFYQNILFKKNLQLDIYKKYSFNIDHNIFIINIYNYIYQYNNSYFKNYNIDRFISYIKINSNNDIKDTIQKILDECMIIYNKILDNSKDFYLKLDDIKYNIANKNLIMITTDISNFLSDNIKKLEIKNIKDDTDIDKYLYIYKRYDNMNIEININTNQFKLYLMKNNKIKNNLIQNSLINIERLIYDLILNNDINNKNIIDIYENSKTMIYELEENVVKKYIKNILLFEKNNNSFYNEIHREYNILKENRDNDIEDIKNIYGFIKQYIYNKLKIREKDIIDIDNLINDNYDKICKYFIFTKYDLRENYGKFNDNIRKPPNEICKELLNSDKLYLELIHPKYCYYKIFNNITDKDILEKYEEKKYQIESHQKQGIFGINSETLKFRTCHDYYFNNFRELKYDEDNKEEWPGFKNFQLNYNKLGVYMIAKRDILFCIRYVNDKRMPLHFYEDKSNKTYFLEKLNKAMIYNENINNENFNKLFKNSNYIYLGIIRKKIDKLNNNNGKNLLFYIFYDKSLDFIITYDQYLNPLTNFLFRKPFLFTYMELQQICMYLNLYGYCYKNDENNIFYSRFNIFDDNEYYPDDIYKPLTKDQFNQILNYYRENMNVIKCYKYPSLDIDKPSGLSKNIINNDKKSTQLYFVKYYKQDNVIQSTQLEHSVNYKKS